MGPLSPKNSGSNTETGRCPSERSTSRQSRVLLQKKIRRLHRKDSKGKSQRSLRLRRNPPFKGLHRKIKDGQRSEKDFGPEGQGASGFHGQKQRKIHGRIGRGFRRTHGNRLILLFPQFFHVFCLKIYL